MRCEEGERPPLTLTLADTEADAPAEGVRVGRGVALPTALREALPDARWEWEGGGEAEGAPLAPPLRDAEEQPVGVPLTPTLREGEGCGEALRVRGGDALSLPSGVCVPLVEPLWEGGGEGDAPGVEEESKEGVAPGLSVPPALLPLARALPEGVLLPLAEPLPRGVADAEAGGVEEGALDGLAPSDGDTAGVRDCDDGPLALPPPADGDALTLADAESVTPAVGSAERVPSLEAAEEGVADEEVLGAAAVGVQVSVALIVAPTVGEGDDPAEDDPEGVMEGEGGGDAVVAAVPELASVPPAVKDAQPDGERLPLGE